MLRFILSFLQASHLKSSLTHLDKDNLVTCNANGHCVNSSFPIKSKKKKAESPSCKATFINRGFTDFTVHPVDCNSSHNVAIFCQHQKIQNTITLQNSKSDVRLSQNISKGFSMLSRFQSCSHGWFRVLDLCIRFFNISRYSRYDKSHAGICEKYSSSLAHHVFRDITFINTSTDTNIISYTLPDQSGLGRFFFPLLSRKKSDRDLGSVFFGIGINSSSLPCNDLHIQLGILDHSDAAIMTDSFSYIWSLNRTISFTNNTNYNTNHNDNTNPIKYVLCEKSLEESSSIPINVACSELYNQCDDGTCIHDGLWCDGVQHCQDGEDERHCQHICSLPDIDCTTDCHIKDHCKCIDTYFQCLSGGCIPLQKICDKTKHCKDESDEPEACEPYTTSATSESPCHQQVNDWSGGDGLCKEYYEIKNRKIIEYYKFPLYKLCILERTECKKACDNIPDDDPAVDYDYPFHLLNCQHFFCVGHFKCSSSYCISLDQVCDGVCQCGDCEDESFCEEKLLCPGLVLAKMVTEQKDHSLYCSKEYNTSLFCSKEYQTLKSKLNRRQLIRTSALSIVKDNPVFIMLHNENTTNMLTLNATNISTLTLADTSSFSAKWDPKIVTHLSIRSYQISVRSMSIFSQMVKMISLRITENGFSSMNRTVFSKMEQLKLLNISYNNIKHLPDLSSLCKLMYLFAQHNAISSLDGNVFMNNNNLIMIVIHSNNLLSIATELNIKPGLIESLQYLSSDLAKLCCIFVKTHRCSPDLPTFMSCSNMIASKNQAVVAWVFSTLALLLDISSVVCLFVILWHRKKSYGKLDIPLIITLNLSLAEMIISACLFCYPVLNIYYDGVFGKFSDQWRHSWKCIGLEFGFFSATQACLGVSVIMSVHFAIVIPSWFLYL